MKSEELIERRVYDKQHRWRCPKCSAELTRADIRFGVWRNINGGRKRTLKDISVCCGEEVIPNL